MIIEEIKKAVRRTAIVLLASAGVSAGNETTAARGSQKNPNLTQSDVAGAKSLVASQPRFTPAGGGKDYEWGKDHIFIKLSRAETGGTVTLIQDNLKPGFNLGMHFHRLHTEIFYILEGEVEFKTDKASFAAKEGSVVYLPAGTPHAAESSTGARMLMFYSPGGFDEMLAEIEGASWIQRISPFARARREKKYDFNKGSNSAPEGTGSKPAFIPGGEGQNTSLPGGSSIVKLNSTATGGLATVIEETLNPGVERVSSLPGNQAEILYVLNGELEVDIATKTQKAKSGATLYFPPGFRPVVKSSAGAKFLTYRTPGLSQN